MLKLNVGFNRKAGEANYGSRGASVNLELELDSGLACDPDRLKERIRSLFLLAKASVDEELTGAAGNGHAAGNGRSHSANGKSAGRSNGNGQSRGQHRDGARGATASQARALRLIAERQGVDLESIVRQRYGVDQPEQLSITEASELIDELKGQTSGNGSGGGR